MKELIFTALAIGLSTVTGAVAGLFVKRIPHKYNDLILGAAAGIMLAAAIFGLIIPAINAEVEYSLPMMAGGVILGALLISILDRLLPHLHKLAGVETEKHPDPDGAGKVLLFVTAIAIHKFPEGLAAGVSSGTGDAADAIVVTTGIALQNIPEALVIVAPLLSIGVSMRRTILISLAIGLISMLGTAAGYYLVNVTALIQPFILAFAGGTMLYVISDEMIPETHSHGFEKQATFSLIAGFLLIAVLQKIIG